MSKNGKIIQVIGAVVDGQAVSSTGELLGTVARNVALDENGNEVDLSDTSVKQDLVFDDSGKPVGKIVGDKILDSKGNVVGKVVDGKAVSLSGEPLGKIVKGVSYSEVYLVSVYTRLYLHALSKLFPSLHSDEVLVFV